MLVTLPCLFIFQPLTFSCYLSTLDILWELNCIDRTEMIKRDFPSSLMVNMQTQFSAWIARVNEIDIEGVFAKMFMLSVFPISIWYSTKKCTNISLEHGKVRGWARGCVMHFLPSLSAEKVFHSIIISLPFAGDLHSYILKSKSGDYWQMQVCIQRYTIGVDIIWYLRQCIALAIWSVRPVLLVRVKLMHQDAGKRYLFSFSTLFSMSRPSLSIRQQLLTLLLLFLHQDRHILPLFFLLLSLGKLQ